MPRRNCWQVTTKQLNEQQLQHEHVRSFHSTSVSVWCIFPLGNFDSGRWLIKTFCAIPAKNRFIMALVVIFQNLFFHASQVLGGRVGWKAAHTYHMFAGSHQTGNDGVEMWRSTHFANGCRMRIRNSRSTQIVSFPAKQKREDERIQSDRDNRN